MQHCIHHRKRKYSYETGTKCQKKNNVIVSSKLHKNECRKWIVRKQNWRKKTARTKWRKLYTTQDILYEQLPYFWNVRRSSHVLPLLHDNNKKQSFGSGFRETVRLTTLLLPYPYLWTELQNVIERTRANWSRDSYMSVGCRKSDTLLRRKTTSKRAIDLHESTYFSRHHDCDKSYAYSATKCNNNCDSVLHRQRPSPPFPSQKYNDALLVHWAGDEIAVYSFYRQC